METLVVDPKSATDEISFSAVVSVLEKFPNLTKLHVALSVCKSRLFRLMWKDSVYLDHRGPFPAIKQDISWRFANLQGNKVDDFFEHRHVFWLHKRARLALFYLSQYQSIAPSPSCRRHDCWTLGSISKSRNTRCTRRSICIFTVFSLLWKQFKKHREICDSVKSIESLKIVYAADTYLEDFHPENYSFKVEIQI